MRGHLRAAVFIAVLIFSVSLLSSAIDILGNLSDIDLDEEIQAKEVEKPAGSADVGRGKAELVRVEASPKGTVHPLFEIQMPPKTKYVRRSVGEHYNDGLWWASEDHPVVPYNGETLELRVSGYTAFKPVDFIIEPLVNISGFVPVTLSAYRIEFEGSLDRYPDQEAYFTTEAFNSSYWVSHVLFEFSDSILNNAQPSNPKNCLGVPDELSDSLRGLALEIVEDAHVPMEKLKALEEYLKTNYEYNESYTRSPPDVDPVEWFLFNEGQGICSHFNSAFVLLARSIGLPARIVNGYLVDAEAETQIVKPKQTHIYAEAKFEDLGWITFDATPERMEEKDVMISFVPTVTNITGNDPVGLKGHNFKVYGTVTAQDGSTVDGLTIQTFLTKSKNQTSPEWMSRRECGMGEVESGFFNITCEASSDIEVGDYMLVARTFGNQIYKGSWSDPPIRIMAETEVFVEASSSVYVGKGITLMGKLIDKSNGQPIANTTVSMEVENETIGLTTDTEGTVRMTHAFETEGNKTIILRLEDSEYYLGSSGLVGITVKPTPLNPLNVLTIFPYNLFLVISCATIVAAVIYIRRGNRLPLIRSIEEGVPPTEFVEDDSPLSFDSYKEGIVKLFNRFYSSTQKRFSGLEDHLTPREFQLVLMRKIPNAGVRVLDDLVTDFEIANYSEEYPSKEDYDRCQTAVETLRRLMEHG